MVPFNQARAKVQCRSTVRGGEVEGSGHLRDGHADEVAQLHNFGSLWILQRQGGERVVDGGAEQLRGVGHGGIVSRHRRKTSRQLSRLHSWLSVPNATVQVWAESKAQNAV